MRGVSFSPCLRCERRRGEAVWPLLEGAIVCDGPIAVSDYDMQMTVVRDIVGGMGRNGDRCLRMGMELLRSGRRRGWVALGG